MKRLYTYPDFVHNSIKESQDINNNLEVFVLNEMQTDWTIDETKSMYDITKDNIYQKLKEKFFQRIDIILTSKDDLYSTSKTSGIGTYYQSKMSEKLYNLNKTYGDYSNIIKNDWQTKVFSKLTSFSPNPQLRAAYIDIQKLGKIKFDATLNIKNAYDLQKRAYDKDAADADLEDDNHLCSKLTGPELTLISKFLNIDDPDHFYKVHTDKLLEETGIDNNNYIEDFTKKIMSPDQKFPLKNFHKVIKKEFYEYYRHYHFWLFANLIMSGTSTNNSYTTSTKQKSSASSVTTPTRERRIVDRAVIGQTISDL